MTRTFVLLLAFLAAPAPAGATESRKTGLARSFLHVDDADLFLYPGMVGEWNRYAFVDAYTSAGDADGGIFLGKSPVFGIVFDHPALWNDIAQTDTVYTNVAAPPVRHVMDLALAFPSGFSSVGALLGWGTALTDFSAENAEGDFESTGAQATVLDLGLGWSSHPEFGTRTDVGLGLTMNLYEQADAGDITVRKSAVPGVHVAGRFLLPLTTEVDLGIEALLARRDYGIEVLPNADGTYSRIVGRVSVGPRIRPTDRATIGFFGRLHVESLAGRVNDDDGPSLFYLGFPGFGASLEYEAGDFVSLRIGGDYQHAYQSISNEPDGPANDTVVAGTGDSTTWGFGVGYHREGYRLDTAMTGFFDPVGGVFGGAQVVLAGSYLFQ